MAAEWYCSAIRVDLCFGPVGCAGARARVTWVSCGSAYLERLTELSAPVYRLELALCQAWAGLCDHAAAEQHFAHALEELEARNVTGVLIGVAYEIEARVALARADMELTTLRLARFEEHIRIGKHPALTARYKALKRAASGGDTEAHTTVGLFQPSDSVMTTEAHEQPLHTQTEPPSE